MLEQRPSSCFIAELDQIVIKWLNGYEVSLDVNFIISLHKEMRL